MCLVDCDPKVFLNEVLSKKFRGVRFLKLARAILRTSDWYAGSLDSLKEGFRELEKWISTGSKPIEYWSGDDTYGPNELTACNWCINWATENIPRNYYPYNYKNFNLWKFIDDIFEPDYEPWWVVTPNLCCFKKDTSLQRLGSWLRWNDGTVEKMASAIYENESEAGYLDSEAIAIMADALEDAGCANEEILQHCRELRPHVRGCWVLDLLLGK
jgi:hypothetical protein